MGMSCHWILNNFGFSWISNVYSWCSDICKQAMVYLLVLKVCSKCCETGKFVLILKILGRLVVISYLCSHWLLG